MSMQTAVSAIKEAKRILIACHINPDGDSIGSMLALGLGLKSLGKDITMLSLDGIPMPFNRLSGAKLVKSTPQSKQYDLAITVDCNSAEMLGAGFSLINQVPLILEIDHHEFRKSFGQKRWIDKNSPAVGEMIYRLLIRLQVKVTADIAESILTSIIVETNSFRLPTVQARTFTLCAQLIKIGVDFSRLTNTVYWAQSKETVILSGLCLSRCQFLAENRLVWSLIHKKDFDKIGGQPEDIDSVPDLMRSIESVLVAVLFREETEGRLRVSLRSKKLMNVGKIAEHFSGGGHYDVAGCVIENTAAARNKLLTQIVKLIQLS